METKPEAAGGLLPAVDKIHSSRPAIVGSVAGKGLVARPRLRDRLLTSVDQPLVLLEAPGGYSKTTTLAEWELADPRQFAWFTCRRWHRDPAVFVAAIVEALGQVTPIDPGILLSLSAPSPDQSVVLSLLQNAVAAIEPGFVLVLDDLYMADEPDCMEVLDAILTSLPRGSQMAVGTRSHPPLALARIRASRGLLEIGPGDLAMTRKESRALLVGTDLNPTDSQFELICSRSEGWAAALYLAGSVLAESDDPAAAIENFSGDDRVMVEYFNQEFLGTLSADEVDFLVRSSILSELTGPKLDYVLERTGSAGLLAELAQKNMLLLPLDRAGSRFRCHHLFSDMLMAELRRTDPDAESILHRRASQWFESKGDMVGAAEHAVASGDVSFASEMIWRTVPEMLSRGRSATLSDLVERSENMDAGRSPHLMLTEAHVAIAGGDAQVAVRNSRLLRELVEAGDKAALRVEGDVLLLEATRGDFGLTQMGADSTRAAELIDGNSPWQTPCLLYLGAATFLEGDAEGARVSLRESASRAASVAPIIQVLALTQLALISFESVSAHESSRLMSQAIDQVNRCNLGGLTPMAFAFAVEALSRAETGQRDKARESASRASELLETMVDFPVWLDAEISATLARTHLATGDPEEARRMLDRTEIAAGSLADSPVITGWLEELRIQLEPAAEIKPFDDGSMLTVSELRTLQYLPTHFSFQEIADSLHLSRNTVKSQVAATYRKLGARTRTEAVRIGVENGLIDDTGPRSAKSPE